MHKTWKAGTKLRLFAVVTSEKENPLEVGRAIEAHLVAVRITAEVKTVDLSDTSIAGDMRHVYTKTVNMQKRRELLRALENPATMSQARTGGAAAGGTATAHATVAEVFGGMFGAGKEGKEKEKEEEVNPVVQEQEEEEEEKEEEERERERENENESEEKKKAVKLTMDERRMKTAVAFNRVLLQHSSKSKLVVTNLPLMRSVEDAGDFCSYCDVMTEGIGAVLMVRGAGEEVVTTYG